MPKTRTHCINCNCAPSTVPCGSCNKELKTVFKGSEQYEDALEIQFTGYYGGYYDSMSPSVTTWICKECADKLLEANPWMRKFMID